VNCDRLTRDVAVADGVPALSITLPFSARSLCWRRHLAPASISAGQLRPRAQAVELGRDALPLLTV
jgi:hypothetical protein